MRITGSYQTLGNLKFFIPYPLPPADPPLALDAELMTLYGEASYELGLLNGRAQGLPDSQRFVRAYVIKEALLSSEIEGIHTTLVEAFTRSESGGVSISRIKKETQLVLNYTEAMNTALQLMRDGVPLVSRVWLRAHEVLLNTGRGDKSAPGQLRKQTVQVGSLVPPPAPEVPQLMAALEKYINEPSELPALLRAGLVHVNFETIHPFLDGNGRIGRLLIVLMLIQDGLLVSPILYPSYYFKKNHFEYYQRLDRVRTHGDFEGWLRFYLTAIRDSAKDARYRAQAIERLEMSMRSTIENDPQFRKIRENSLHLLRYLFNQPISSIKHAHQALQVSYNTIKKILSHFVELGWVEETLLGKSKKSYRLQPFLELLERDFSTQELS